ncbi:MAG: efflux RND transporter periplasmic adaptor subunit [Pseudomonadota bacterium]
MNESAISDDDSVQPDRKQLRLNFKEKFAKRVRRQLLTFGGTLGAIAISVFAVTFLSGFLSQRQSLADGPLPEPPVGVETAEVTRVENYTVTRRFVGTVEPARTTDLAFELPGIVDTVLVDEGDLVRRGQLVASIDTSLLDADRARLGASVTAQQAQLELARRTLMRRQELNVQGHVSDQALDEIALSEVELVARIAEARAALSVLDVRLQKSELRAPFDGRVAERFLDDGAIAANGVPVVRLIEETRPRIRVGVDPLFATQLSAGDAASIEIGGMAFDGIVERLPPDLELRTRTRPVLLSLDVLPEAAVGLYGRTGTVSVESVVETRGAWLPLTAIREGSRGTWSILVLDDVQDGVGVVRMEAIEVIDTDGEQVFARGSFRDGALVIQTGLHRVVPGQEAIDLNDPSAADLLFARARQI